MKYLLLASVAAFAATPALAQVDSTVTFNNAISSTTSSAETHATDTTLAVDVTGTGNIEVDSAATANSDDKQVIEGNTVDFLRGLNDEDGTVAANGVVTNTTDTVDVEGANGNVAVNAATGYFNAQSNVGTIGVVTSASPVDENGAWGKANTTAWQSLNDTSYGAVATGNGENALAASFMDSNAASVGDVDGAGNIGINSAAGAFNGQQNIMTLAVATNSSLANATAGVIQSSTGNAVRLNDSDNTVNLGAISGDGNIAINTAAGVGNLQHNSLTVSAAGAFGGGAGTGGLAGNGGFTAGTSGTGN